jgi:hypothetical protein
MRRLPGIDQSNEAGSQHRQSAGELGEAPEPELGDKRELGQEKRAAVDETERHEAARLN